LAKKSVPWNWGEKEDVAFYHVQEIINHADILAQPDFSKKFYLWVDASNVGYGGVLMQQTETGDYVPVELISNCWKDSELIWHPTTKEIKALTECVAKWDIFLQQPFTIHSDAKNIEWLMKRSDNFGPGKNNPMHYRMLFKLKGYDFEVKHVAGIKNVAADYLSRYIDYGRIAESKVQQEADRLSDADDAKCSELDECELKSVSDLGSYSVDSRRNINDDVYSVYNQYNRRLSFTLNLKMKTVEPVSHIVPVHHFQKYMKWRERNFIYYPVVIININVI